MVAPSRLLRVVAVSFVICAPVVAQAQLESLRKARDLIKDKLPTVDMLFGRESPITTSLDDARDGVPSMDGFSPQSYSPTYEMPVGQDGTILLVPGAYAMQVKSYCLKPGTFGPQSGDGYLHTQWEGPKADLISEVIVRATYHPEIPQYHVQMLLWGILARTKMSNLQREASDAAFKLLSPTELLELNGYGLGVVPNALRDRVLKSVPGPARRLFEAENDMRRMLTSADAKYADMERVAVLTGEMPASAQTMYIPAGRWSYHPAGVFVRYDVMHYSRSRMDIYYPETVNIQRDGSGRIISVASHDGRRIDLGASNATVSFASMTGSAASNTRLAVLSGAMRNDRVDATNDLLELARADYEDLSSIRLKPAQDRRLIEMAMHTAIARLYGIARHPAPIVRGSQLEVSLRPVRNGNGFTYAIAPVSAYPQHPGRMMPLQPSGGGGTGPNQRQRAGMSPPPPMFLAGGNQPLPGEPDALDKAKAMTDKLQAASDILGAATDPAGTLGSKAPFQPGSMLGSGLDAAYGAARDIGNAFAGSDGSAVPMPGSNRVAETMQQWTPPVIPVSFVRKWSGYQSGYRTYARPTTINFQKVVAGNGVSAQHADAANAVLSSTFKLATTLDAWAITRRRFVDAAKARDMDWQYNQGLAIVYLKRTAGGQMLRLADDLERLIQITSRDELVTAEGLTEGQRQLKANGFPAATLAVATQLGRTGTQMEEYKRRALAGNPGHMASEFRRRTEELQEALTEYGTHLTRLPSVKAPWELPGQ
jgi:hypothetical protein